jgi:hypothetical protein
MSRYGLNYYGLGNSLYGPDATATYISSSFTARSENHGQIVLLWSTPSGTWSTLRIVRNSYGFPVDAWDGDVLVDSPKEQQPGVYDDDNLTTNKFFYYSIFVYELNTYEWVRAGNAIGVSVKDYGYGLNLYKSLPEIYKITQIYIATEGWDNPELLNFLKLFGFQLDYAHTLTNLMVNRYDLENVGGQLLPAMLQQFGLNYEPEIGYQQSRILVRDIVTIGKKKGSSLGLRDYMKAFTGYPVPRPIAGTPNPSVDGVLMGRNLMLDYNDSSFEEGVGNWASSNSSAVIKSLKVQDITAASITSNVAKFTIGAHDYAVGNKFTATGFLQPLFNITSATTITAVDATSISFALVNANVATLDTYVSSIESYPKIYPAPVPWAESTAPVLSPNKQKGILAVKNNTGSTGTVLIECGYANPITKGVPVTTGLNYIFSAYSSAGTTVETITMKIRWYTRLGAFISEASGTPTANTIANPFSTRLSVSAAAPAAATYAVPVISIAGVGASSSNEYHYFDAMQFEQAATITAFEEARQVRLTLKANRINELLNPHFASPITPWAVTGASPTVDTTTQEPGVSVFTVAHKSLTSNIAKIETTVSHGLRAGDVVVITGVDATFNGTYTIATANVNTTDPTLASRTFTYAKTATNVTRVAASGSLYKSGNALKMEATATSALLKSTTTTADLMSIHYPSTFYTFSIYAQVSTGSATVTPKIIWYNSSKVAISPTVTGTATTVTKTGTNWDRISLSAIAPATAAYAHVELAWSGTTIGNFLWVDSALFENSGVVGTYFDASGGSCSPSDLLWEGSANASRSHYYKNKFAVQTRLTRTALYDQMPLGSTVAVYLGQTKT